MASDWSEAEGARVGLILVEVLERSERTVTLKNQGELVLWDLWEKFKHTFPLRDSFLLEEKSFKTLIKKV